MKDTYKIAITSLSILLLISIIIISFLIVITTDLRDAANMYENSKNVCELNLKNLEKSCETLEVE